MSDALRAQIEEHNTAELTRLRSDLEKAIEALEHVKQWSEAYPLAVFQEPDFAKAREVLEANGMTLDAISASNMRHVLSSIGPLVSHVLSQLENSKTPIDAAADSCP